MKILKQFVNTMFQFDTLAFAHLGILNLLVLASFCLLWLKLLFPKIQSFNLYFRRYITSFLSF